MYIKISMDYCTRMCVTYTFVCMFYPYICVPVYVYVISFSPLSTV